MTQPSHFLGTIGIRNTPGAPYTEADSGKEEDVKTPIGTSSYLESLIGPVLTWMEVKDFAALNACPRDCVSYFLFVRVRVARCVGNHTLSVYFEATILCYLLF